MFKKLLFFLEIIVLLFFLFWHLKLGLVRYFDADEFAHLHWGYSLSIGERPYTDFFYLFPPFFLYIIASIVKIFGRTVQAILAARVFIFFVFLAASGLLFLIVKKLRGMQTALLTVIFFAFLPLPFDKMIEIRPDMVATGLAMMGMMLFMTAEANKTNKTHKTDRWYFASGLAYAASLGFVPKTVFFLLPVGLIIAYKSYKNYKKAIPFLLGFIPVGLVLFLVLLSFGDVPFSLYSMTRMASEVTKSLGVKFYMRPDIFFYPNDTYYGFGGWSAQLVATIVIYIAASVWAIHRLVSLGSSTIGGVMARASRLPATPEVSSWRTGIVGEFLMAGSFWANLTAFVYFYPLKHAQYLIMVAPFIAFYAADLLFVILRSGGDEGSRPNGRKQVARFFASLRMTTLLMILLLISIISFQMNQQKEQWVNTGTLEKVSYFLKTIAAGEPVYDLTGESIFFRNGYYFCCLPYGQYEEALYFKIPDLERELDKRGTKYVHLGTFSRLNEIPERHARYIKENFTPVAVGSLLWERK